jgi:hypothetical protein
MRPYGRCTSLSRNTSSRVASQIEHMWRAYSISFSASAGANPGNLTPSVTSSPNLHPGEARTPPLPAPRHPA